MQFPFSKSQCPIACPTVAEVHSCYSAPTRSALLQHHTHWLEVALSWQVQVQAFHPLQLPGSGWGGSPRAVSGRGGPGSPRPFSKIPKQSQSRAPPKQSQHSPRAVPGQSQGQSGLGRSPARSAQGRQRPGAARRPRRAAAWGPWLGLRVRRGGWLEPRRLWLLRRSPRLHVFGCWPAAAAARLCKRQAQTTCKYMEDVDAYYIYLRIVLGTYSDSNDANKNHNDNNTLVYNITLIIIALLLIMVAVLLLSFLLLRRRLAFARRDSPPASPAYGGVPGLGTGLWWVTARRACRCLRRTTSAPSYRS